MTERNYPSPGGMYDISHNSLPTYLNVNRDSQNPIPSIPRP